jgi:hypothetical protein
MGTMERFLGTAAAVSFAVVFLGVIIGLLLGAMIGVTGAILGLPMVFWGGCSAAVAVVALRLIRWR